MLAPNTSFSQQIIDWYQRFGRHDLPWQDWTSPYKVWVSEVMLQQTQVKTVIPYFQRFLERFPVLSSLAEASLDEVLSIWSGLGYYVRARNLHLTSKLIVEKYQGKFPTDPEQINTLPGIGPSTAATIGAFCFFHKKSVFDGNVQRVISRFVGFSEELAVTKNLSKLRQIATELLPENPQLMPQYTQGIIDLGALVCHRANPLCLHCPVQNNCLAHQNQWTEQLPVKSRYLVKKKQSFHLAFIFNENHELLLVKRPPSGIWSNLYCVPLFADLENLVTFYKEINATQLNSGKSFLHHLTHIELNLFPYTMLCHASSLAYIHTWIHPQQLDLVGIPAPIKKWIQANFPL